LIPVVVLAGGALLIQAAIAARKQHIEEQPRRRLGVKALIFWLQLLQPLARLLGRMRHGIGPWGLEGFLRGPVRLTDTRALWTEKRRSQSAHLAAIEEILLGRRTI